MHETVNSPCIGVNGSCMPSSPKESISLDATITYLCSPLFKLLIWPHRVELLVKTYAAV